MSATTPAPPGRVVPTNRNGPPPPITSGRRGLSDAQRQSARVGAQRTRTVWRALGSGQATANNHPTVRGFVWLFVWLGVLFYMISNPATLPTIVHLVFAPVNGILAVARGTRTPVPNVPGH